VSREFEDLLKRAEERIVAGQIRQAAEVLDKIKPTSVARNYLCRVAQLLRRVGSYDAALRLLMPIVRPKAKLVNPASNAEKAEYAICLQRFGSLEEARDLLNEIPEDAVPDALLYKAIFHFPNWEYAEAVPHLERLIAITAKGSYLHQVGCLNLSAALVTAEKYQEAESVLSELRQATADAGRLLLFCNALEVSAQAAIFSGRFAMARDFLNSAESVLSGVKTFDRLWLIKWRAILNAIENKEPAFLAPAREEAKLKQHWETHRELDFISCKIRYDADLARKLYYGSAAPRYRERIARHIEIPSSPHIYVLKDREYRSEAEGAVHCMKDLTGQLSAGDLPNLVLLNLLSDAYRGLRSGQIHSRLFPGDFFNPYTSLDRVHQVIKRVRTEAEEQIKGLEIEHVDGVYSLDLTALKTPIEIPPAFPELSGLNVKLQSLSLSLRSEVFDSKDVQKVFSLSRAAANRLISAWRENEAVKPEGNPRSPSYRIKKSA
jgi:hypothetical protein